MSLDEAIYRGEDYFSRPKESFSFLGERIDALPGNSLLDLGCARGEFLHFLSRRTPGRWALLSGIDLSAELVGDARRRLTEAPFSFAIGDIESPPTGPRHDIVTAAGVLGYLDDPATLAAVAADRVTSGGHLIVFGFLNMVDADVFSEFRYQGHREKANLHAHRNLCLACTARGFAHVRTDEFVLPFKAAPNPQNARRAWTIDTEYGRFFANGLGQYFRLYAAIFRGDSCGS